MTDIGWCVECQTYCTVLDDCIEGHRGKIARIDLADAVLDDYNKSRLKRLLERKIEELDHQVNFEAWYGNMLYHIDDCVELPVEEEDY